MILKKVFLSLNLDNPERGWTYLNPWEGPARKNAILISQNIGHNKFLFLIGGETLVKDNSGKIHLVALNDCYRYTLRNSEWEQITDIPYPIAASPAISYGQSHILLFGKSKLKLLKETDTIERTQGTEFSVPLLGYQTITNKWVIEGKISFNLTIKDLKSSTCSRITCN